jgi:hypothetical protein
MAPPGSTASATCALPTCGDKAPVPFQRPLEDGVDARDVVAVAVVILTDAGGPLGPLWMMSGPLMASVCFGVSP